MLLRTFTHVPFLTLSPKIHFSSVAQLCPTLCDPMNRSTPGLPVHHQLPEFTQTHVHWVSDAIQPFHPLLSPSPPVPNQGLFQWVNVTMLPLLKIILWFPLFFRINLKILNMSCNTLHDSGPLTLLILFHFCAPATQTFFCFLECVAFHLASSIFHKLSFFSKCN